jgi:hypothetical protein
MVPEGCGTFFCKGQEDGRIGKKTRRGRDESEEEQTGTQSADASLVSAGLLRGRGKGKGGKTPYVARLLMRNFTHFAVRIAVNCPDMV